MQRTGTSPSDKWPKTETLDPLQHGMENVYCELAAAAAHSICLELWWKVAGLSLTAPYPLFHRDLKTRGAMNTNSLSSMTLLKTYLVRAEEVAKSAMSVHHDM